jgi:acyl transferase domain-containing protein/3-hydroxyacyl-CoA dehydrogenase/phosphopantetheinyl transferase
MNDTDIAVVGMGCVFPGAADLDRFWANMVDGVDAVTDPPPDRLNGQLNFRPFVPCLEDISRPVTRGGFIPGEYRFDPLRYGVLPKNVRDGDPDQFLALAVIDAALGDAGIAADDTIRGRCDVIMGRGGYMTNKMAEGYVHIDLLPHLLLYLRREFPDWSAERFADFARRLRATLPADGGADSTVTCMPNLAASRAANRLDLRGAAYTVDGACASSLLAVEHAVVRLRAGLCDAAVACGLQLVQLPAFWAVFAQLGALSPGNVMRPFDRGADGLLVGEGGGAVVLKRLADARRAGDRVYAVIRGVGTSSDGRGTAILTPNWRGQVDALRRAYADARVDPASIGYLEAHGTATQIGDPVEAHTIKAVYGERGGLPPTRALGSVKSMIGHLMAGAGIASFIRTVLAVSNKVLPPSLHCDEPLAALDDSTFYINTETRPWIHAAGRGPRRAGVNAFGFGGVNVHVVLEEVPEAAGVGPLPRPITCPRSRATELFAFAAATPGALADRLERTAAATVASCKPTLAELSAAVLDEAGGGACRLTMVARSLDGLRDELVGAAARLRAGEALGESDDLRSSTAAAPPGRVAAVFPGLSFPGVGGAYGAHLVELCLHFPEMRRLFDALEARDGHPDDPVPTSVLFAPPRTLPREWRERLERRTMLPQLGDLRVGAGERPAVDRPLPVAAVAIANWLGWRLIETLGVSVDCVVGQSMGELCACTAAGVFAVEDMAAGLWAGMDVPPYLGDGQLAAVFATEEQLAPVLAEAPGTSIAVHVAPRVQVVGGPMTALESFVRGLAARGIVGQLLPYPPVHTPACDFLNDTVMRAMESAFHSFHEPRLDVYSCAAGVPYPRSLDDMREVAVRILNHPVRFWQAIRRMHDEGVRVFIEAGNGGMASTVRTTLARDEAVVAAVDDEAVDPLTQTHRLCARLFAAGVPVDLAALHRHRGLRPLDLSRTDLGVQDTAGAMDLPLKLSQLPFGAEVFTQGLAAVERAGQTAVEATEPALMDDARGAPAGVDADAGADAEPEADAAESGCMPFIGDVVEHEPGTRIVIERTLDLDRDLFLHDHVFVLVQDRKPLEECMPVLPAAAMVEALAEAAHTLVPDRGVIGVERMKAMRWIALEDRRSLPLRIEARVEGVDPDSGTVSVAAELFADGEPRAAAMIRLGPAYEQTLEPVFSPRDGSRPWHYTAEEIYRDRHAFHGPRLQCLVESGPTGAGGGDGTLLVLPVDDWFADDPRPRMLLDVAILDGVAQALGGWTRGYGRVSVPLGFEKLELYRHTPSPGTRCPARLELVKGGEGSRAFVFDVEVGDGAGHVWMRIRNFTMWAFEIPPRAARAMRRPAEVHLSHRRDLTGLPEATVAARLGGGDLPGFNEEWLGRACLTRVELDALRTITAPRRRRQWLLGRLAAKDAVRMWYDGRPDATVVHPLDFEIATDDRGRPVVRPLVDLPAPPALSITHTGDTAYALAAATACGIDVESAGRPVEEIARHVADARERGIAADMCGDGLLRLWCAKEAVGKALGSGLAGRPGDFRAVSTGADGRLVVAHAPTATEHAVATLVDEGFVVAFTPAAEPAALAVFGAGHMGGGIAGIAVDAGLRVALVDVDAAAAERGRRQALAECGGEWCGCAAAQDATHAPCRGNCPAALLRAGTDAGAVAGADVVIESIVEDAAAKRDLYAMLEPRLRPDAILATNTSSIRVATLARHLARPERFCGLHFFNPIRSLRLVEVVRCPATSDETVAKAVDFVRRIGGRPLVVGDGPGFLVNRLLFSFMNEAVALLLEGATVREVDEAVMAMGLPAGPLAMFDVVGLDVSYRVGRNFWLAYPDRVVLSAVVPKLVEAGRLGHKSGRGFYAYDDAGNPHDDPAVENVIRACRTGGRRIPPDEIVERLLLVTLLEATRLIDDRIPADVRDIDVALVEGAGFPPRLGGLLAWADSVGAAAILEMLEPFAPLGHRMRPTPRLVRMAETGETFLGPSAGLHAGLPHALHT